MEKTLRLIVAAALMGAGIYWLRFHAKEKPKDDGTFTVTIQKKPKEIVTDGPVMIYRYDMSGTDDYQWVYVPTDESKVFVVSLLKALKVIKDGSGTGVKTLAEVKARKIVPGERQDTHDAEIAQLTADLQSHAAVVDSYENRPAGK